MSRLSKHAVAGLSVLLAVAARGETAPPVITSESFIADCLCESERVRQARLKAEDAQKEFDAARGRMNALQAHIDAARPTVDPDDQAQIEAFRRLLAEEDKATDHLFDDVQPRVRAVIRRYNDDARAYSERCAGRSLDAAIMARLQTELACLKPAQPSP